MQRSANQLRRNVQRVSPGGPRGRIGSTVYGIVIGERQIEVGVVHPGARALNYGAYITPKGLSKLPYRELVRQKRRLKFEINGKVIFAPLVRYKGTHYFERGLVSLTRVIDEEWRRAFNDLGRLGQQVPTAVGRILPRE